MWRIQVDFYLTREFNFLLSIKITGKLISSYFTWRMRDWNLLKRISVDFLFRPTALPQTNKTGVSFLLDAAFMHARTKCMALQHVSGNVVSFSMGARWWARAPVMRLKSRRSRDVSLRWGIYNTRRAGRHLKIHVQHPMVPHAYTPVARACYASKCECRARRVCVT